ncbi:MAG: glycolate oxidase subunit GlcF [Alphaproteobacteria bacterium]
MQTHFTPERLADPDLAEANAILRKCVHCGFCTATCPSYVLLGDELDSPRGRIYLIKDMLENDKPATEKTALHIDRCLSCLSCMTTCPSDVNYMHLVDQARARIEATFRRPWRERAIRALIAAVLPHAKRFRLAMAAARLARPFRALLPKAFGPMFALVPARSGAPQPAMPQMIPAEGTRRMRVALLPGCVQGTLAPEINAATIRLLARHGCEVVLPTGVGCCGALVHHLGRDALDQVRANVAAWCAEQEKRGLDAIVINASGCGTMVKDYGFLLRTDPEWAERGAAVSALAKDISEVIASLGLANPLRPAGLKVAYHAACSLQHGQRVRAEPKALLMKAGFETIDVPEGHLCCGSAGTYNILQPALAGQLRARKLANIARTEARVIATGNIGCMVQLEEHGGRPVVHTAELLDWATGGPRPPKLASLTET